MSDASMKPGASTEKPQTGWADRALVGAGIIAVLALAAVLWSQAGRDVFAAAMAGLWALCF